MVLRGFNSLTDQKRVVIELKFLWQVNTTGDSPKFILSPEQKQQQTNKQTKKRQQHKQ